MKVNATGSSPHNPACRGASASDECSPAHGGLQSAPTLVLGQQSQEEGARIRREDADVEALTQIGIRNHLQRAVEEGVTGIPNDSGALAGTDEEMFAGALVDEDHDPGDSQELSEEEKREVQELKQRDREVRAHEMAHMAAGGGLVQGGASYTYQRGPDGRSYAVGGEVSISISSEATTEATIAKARRVAQAAMAPANPSSQDRMVAARASRMVTRATQAAAEERRAEMIEAREEAGEVARGMESMQIVQDEPGGEDGVAGSSIKRPDDGGVDS